MVLATHVSVGHNGLTLWGVRLYFWSRVVHAIASVAGFPLVRSAIWNVAVTGIVLLIVALL